MTKRKRLRAITYREYCESYICALCPEYNKEQNRCNISTELIIAENAEYRTYWGTYLLVEVKE